MEPEGSLPHSQYLAQHYKVSQIKRTSIGTQSLWEPKNLIITKLIFVTVCIGMEDRSIICFSVMRVGKLNIGILLWISSGHVFYINRLSMSNAVISNAQTFSCWEVLAVMITIPLINRLKNTVLYPILKVVAVYSSWNTRARACVCVCVCVCVRIDLSI
jgi:hypothetical protein